MNSSRQPIDHSSRNQRLALGGLLVNLALAILKLITGLVGNSYALVADSIESMVDIVGSVVIWGGLHIAAKPADEEHPYGHGRAESLAAIIVAMMVIAAGAGIAIKAIEQLLRPTALPAAFTLWVLIAVIIVKESMFRIVRRRARASGSSAVHVDAWHHRSDAITSLAALIGISAAVLGGIAWADGAAALAASAIIILNGILLFRRPMNELMDREPTEIVLQARRIAESVPGVINTHKVTARHFGVTYWIDMHVRVDPQMTVQHSHALGHQVKDQVRAALPRVADVLVHIEPGTSTNHPPPA
jgi:cation diffusion facilitator family transporter